MTVKTGGIRRGASIPPDPLDILGSFADGSVSRGLLRGGVSGIPRGGAGGPSVPQHIQCGVRRSGSTLGKGNDRATRRAVRVRTGGTTPKRPILRG